MSHCEVCIVLLITKHILMLIIYKYIDDHDQVPYTYITLGCFTTCGELPTWVFVNFIFTDVNSIPDSVVYFMLTITWQIHINGAELSSNF